MADTVWVCFQWSGLPKIQEGSERVLTGRWGEGAHINLAQMPRHIKGFGQIGVSARATDKW